MIRVGICWAGSSGHLNDHNRSMTVEMLAPIFTIPGCEFTSLQIGPRAKEADGTPMKRIDHLVGDFLDTARILETLDLVITVDTSTAHLAGALGIKTWMMLPTNPDFRWMYEGDKTVWYDSMTLYRQTERQNWQPVVQRIASDLFKLTQCKTSAA